MLILELTSQILLSLIYFIYPSGSPLPYQTPLFFHQLLYNGFTVHLAPPIFLFFHLPPHLPYAKGTASHLQPKATHHITSQPPSYPNPRLSLKLRFDEIFFSSLYSPSPFQSIHSSWFFRLSNYVFEDFGLALRCRSYPLHCF